MSGECEKCGHHALDCACDYRHIELDDIDDFELVDLVKADLMKRSKDFIAEMAAWCVYDLLLFHSFDEISKEQKDALQLRISYLVKVVGKILDKRGVE